MADMFSVAVYSSAHMYKYTDTQTQYCDEFQLMSIFLAHIRCWFAVAVGLKSRPLKSQVLLQTNALAVRLV